jgi:thiol-disulfide isomerase/thioredoxin
MMIKKTISLIIFTFLNAVHLLCQEDFTVKLTPSCGSYPSALSLWIVGSENFDKSFFKGIPDSIKSLRIVYLDFHDAQGAYERLIKNRIKKGDADILEQNDTTELSKTPIKHLMYFISGYCKGAKIIIPDLNFNNDFSDDEALVFTKFNFRTKEDFNQNISENLKTFNYEFYEKRTRKVVIKSVFAEILPNNPYVLAGKNEKDTEFDFFIRIAENRKGTFNIKNHCYEFMVSPASGSLDDYEYDFRMYIDSCNYGFQRKYMSDELANKYQKIKIGESYYQIKLNRFGDTAFFKSFGQNKFRTVIRNRIHDGVSSKIDLSAYKDKYLIIDFWGTWCQPCVKAMPNIKKINDFIDKSKVEIIGVAFDSDKKKVQDFLEQKGYNWSQIFEHISKKSPISLIKELNITTFPTAILVDKDGIILEENLPIDNLFEIRKILAKYVK